MKTRIMYIEYKGGGLTGPARIGRVAFTKSRRGYRYQGKTFLKVSGYKYNCIDAETGERYWISGPHKDGADRLYGERVAVEIDEEAREEYWTAIRERPGDIHKKTT